MGMRASFPRHIERLTTPVGRAIAATGLKPNHLTMLGLVLTAVAATIVANDRPVVGGWVLMVGGLMDTFDGAVARARGAGTPYGAFLDSVSDRLSDGIILVGFAWWLRPDASLFGLVLVALVASQVTSYVRAKAEAIDLDCSVGLLERAERAMLLVVALWFHQWLLALVLWILAVGGTVTVIQRIHHVWCQIERDVPPELLGLTQGDRAWNRAYRAAARVFFGEPTFQEAERQVEEAR